MSNNLSITQMTSNQNQKFQTHNDANGEIDAAITEPLSVDVTSGNATVSDANYRRNVRFLVTGATTGGRTVTLPAIRRQVWVQADTANTQSVSIVRGSTTYTLIPGERIAVYTDGTTNGLTVLSSNIYDFGCSFDATPTASTVITRLRVGQQLHLPANMVGSSGGVGTNPAASYDIDVQDDGASIGTINITTGGVVSFTTVGGTSKTIAAGSEITFVAPANAGETIANASFLVAARVA